MFTRASKLFFGLALAGLIGGVLYGIITNGFAGGGVVSVLSGDGAVNAVIGPLTFGYKGGVGDQLGYSLFMGFAVCSFAMAFSTSAFRDGDPEALAELANSASVPPISEPNDISQWPIVAAFSLALMTLGLAVGPVLFSIGAAVLAVAAFEWVIKDWSERATGDAEVNRIIRNRLMYPVELPIAGLTVIAIVVFSFSRILLTSSKMGAVWVASAVGIVIFALAILMGSKAQIRRGAIVGVVLAGAAITVGLGIFGAVRGEREIKHHDDAEHAAAVTPFDYSTNGALGDTDHS